MRPRLSVLALALALGSFALAAPAPAVAAPATCGGEPATIVGSPGKDDLTGTAGPDVIAALGGDDEIHSLGGDDVLCGGAGMDLLDAGPGDDELHGGTSAFHSDRGGTHLHGDTLVPGPGDDLVDAGVDPRASTDDDDRYWEQYPDVLDLSGAPGPLDVDLPAGTADGDGHDVLLPGLRAVVGGAYDDVLTGTASDDDLDGAAGADTLDGGAGDDELSGDARGGGDGAADVLTGGVGDDSLFTDEGPDRLDGGPGDDYLSDDDSDADVMRGGDGDDTLYSGNPFSATAGGLDRLYGDGGDDEMTYLLSPGEGQVVDGGEGANTVTLYAGFSRNGTRQRPEGTTDLRDGTTTVEWPTPTSAPVQNASVLTVPARWTVWGTDGPDQVRGYRDGWLVAHGRGGDDLLIGTPYVDHLDGGDGTDTAYSEAGDDTCVDVEVTDIVGDTCDPAAVLGPAEQVATGRPGEHGYRPQLSADGRFAVFETRTALVPTDTNGTRDVYVQDLRTGDRELVSVTSDGSALTMASGWPDVSADGRFVVFASRGAAVDGLRPGEWRIFVHDRASGRTTLESVNSRGERADDWSQYPSISDDGSRIAFVSDGSNLGGGSTGIYVRDRRTKRTVLVSRRADGSPSTSEVDAPEISGDGRFVLFPSEDRGLSETRRAGLFVRDLAEERTQWVAMGGPYHWLGSISADGRFVAYSRTDPECEGDDADCSVVMVRDLRSGRLFTASRGPHDQPADGGSYLPELSGNGRFVLFTSAADNLVEGDDNGAPDVFVRDLRTGITTLVSAGHDGPSGSPDREEAAIAFAGGGRRLAYESGAVEKRDLFVRSWSVTGKKK